MRAPPSSMVRGRDLESRKGGTDATHNIYTPDFLVFLSIVFFAKRCNKTSLNFQTILGKIAEDATRYFLVIFTSHFVLVMTLNLGRVSTTLSLLDLSAMPIRVFQGINTAPSGHVSRRRSALIMIRRSSFMISITTISGTVV